MLFAVCGLHLRGGPLNYQLLEAGAKFVRDAKTNDKYTMHALTAPNTPPKPGLVFHPDGCATAASIPVEIWDMPEEPIGRMLTNLPSPLCFGSIFLDNGERVVGYVSEGWAFSPSHAKAMGMDSVDITSYGGWRNYAEKVLANSAS